MSDIPILGKEGRFNDNFRPHLVDTIYSAIRTLDEMGYIDVNRLAHGGHSYGAFTTGNLLAHTPFFKAGIAGDGAYNRTLTPMTFQGERRNFWDAPNTYTEISPFFFVDQIQAPLLMYHGAQDNNSGTFLIQSERMMQALTVWVNRRRCTYIPSNRTRRAPSKTSSTSGRAGWSGSTSTSRTHRPGPRARLNGKDC